MISFKLRAILAAGTALSLGLSANPAMAQLVRAGDLIAATDSSGNAGRLLVVDTTATRTDMTVLSPVVVANWDRFNVPQNTTVNVTNGAGIPRAALVNRVIGNRFSDISGSINAPNVNLWLINQNGILFGSGAAVNSSSFFASTLDLPDQDAFDFYEGTDLAGNGASTLALSGSFGNSIQGNSPNIRFVTDGSLMFVSERVNLNANFDAGSGRVSFIAAANVNVSFTPNSPLTFTVSAGSTVAEAMTIGGTVTGAGADFGMITAAGVTNSILRVDATVNANAAQPTSNGIRLFAQQSGAGTVSVQLNGEVTSAGKVQMLGDGILDTKSITASDVNVRFGSAISTGNITATAGAIDVGSTNGGALRLRDLSATGSISLDTTSGIDVATAAGAIVSVGSARLPSSVAFSGPITAGEFSARVSGALTFGAINRIQKLTAISVGAPLNIRNDVENLTISGVVTTNGGDATIRNSRDITIADGGQVSGNIVTISAGDRFINLGGGDAITAFDRWAVYSQAPLRNTFGGLDSGNTAVWNGTIDTVAVGSLSGNRYVFAFRPTITVSSTNTSKVYGTDVTGGLNSFFVATGFQRGVAGAFVGDTLANVLSGAPVITSLGAEANADVLAGPYVMTVNQGTLAAARGYALTLDSSGRLTITPKAITANVTANNKTYDGNRTGSGTVTLNGVVAGDTVGTAGTTFTFADKNAGTGKTVAVAGTTLTGADAGNYTLTVPASALADIIAKAITANVTANNKTYDGNRTGSGTVTLNGVVAGDTVGTAGTTFTFADKNAGTGKTVAVAGTTLTGADAGNYTLTVPASALADIIAKAITANVTANNKTYDGNRTGSGTVTLNGVVAGDTVGTAGTTFTFADKNAGTGKTVAVAGTTLTGADAGNYTLTVPASALADIIAKAITANVTANNKTYDGNRTGSGTVTLNGVVAGDTVGTAGTTFTFADKNAGTGKTVAVAGTTLTGADAGNYTLTVPASALADIIAKAITANVTANNKTYDGNRTGSGTVTLNGVVAGDTVGTAGTTFTFADKNAGTGKTVAVAGTTLTGADAGNYTLTVPASALADIIAKAITANVTANNKTYDGNRTGSGTVTLNGVVAGDTVGTAGTTFTFADKNAGTGKTVAVAGTTLTGADAGNYTLTVPASALADIIAKAITANVTANNKTYDGNRTGSGTVTLNGVVAGDTVGTAGTTFTFADKNAGTGKTVAVAGTTLTGADAGNYTLTVPASALADIIAKAITANVTANNKTYDGNRTGSGTVTLNGVVAGDTVGTAGTTFTFADKNAGTGKTVAVAGTTLTGADAGNYTLTVPASALADIIAKAITANVTANNKTYDGNRTGSGTVTLNGVVAGDTVGTAGTTFTFADKNAGTGKTVAVAGTTLTGADAGNYTLTVPASALADIIARLLVIQADDREKVIGSADPKLTFQIAGAGLVQGETLAGLLARNAGEALGNYAITRGTLSAGDNYTVEFRNGTFTIVLPPFRQVPLRSQVLPNDMNSPRTERDLRVDVDDLCGTDRVPVCGQ